MNTARKYLKTLNVIDLLSCFTVVAIASLLTAIVTGNGSFYKDFLQVLIVTVITLFIVARRRVKKLENCQ